MLYDLFVAPFVEFGFMRRALVGAIALSFASAPLGIFLMLRRMSLTGDAMAHAILPGAAIGFLVSGLSIWAMAAGGLLAGLVVALLSGLVSRFSVLKEDAALATFYLLSLALGVTIVSLKGSNVDLMRVLFGSILALDDDALAMVALAATISLVTLASIYRPLVADCVDPTFLRIAGGHGGRYHGIFLGLVVLNLVAGFAAIGTLLAVGLMIIPAVIGRLLSEDLTGMIATAVSAALAACLAGILISYHLGLPTGPAIILCGGAIYLACLFGMALANLARSYWPTRHLEA